MLSIAVCDDEKLICSDVENKLKQIGKKNFIKIEVEAFYSGEDLLSYIAKGGFFDIVFLDIELGKIDGIMVGKKIREELQNDSLQIVYISAHESYAMDLFDIRPLNFIIKPVDTQKIEKVIKTAFNIIHNSRQHFEYKIGSNTYRKPISEIVYFESDNRKIIIKTLSGKVSFYGTMSKVLEQIHDHPFLYIHKSYLVNYHHITAITYSQVTMADNTVLSISQKRRKEIRALHLEIGRAAADYES